MVEAYVGFWFHCSLYPNILIDRYEWFLYQQIPDRLNGQLTLPDITKYRALDADLIDGVRNRSCLTTQSHGV